MAEKRVAIPMPDANEVPPPVQPVVQATVDEDRLRRPRVPAADAAEQRADDLVVSDLAVRQERAQRQTRVAVHVPTKEVPLDLLKAQIGALALEDPVHAQAALKVYEGLVRATADEQKLRAEAEAIR
jgi:hypothetical protein